MERTITLHWDKYVDLLLTLPDPTPEREKTVSLAEDFIERILSQDLPSEFIFNLTDEIIETGWEIIGHESTGSDALLDTAQMRMDESVWDDTVNKIFQLSSICDSSIQGEFI